MMRGSYGRSAAVASTILLNDRERTKVTKPDLTGSEETDDAEPGDQNALEVASSTKPGAPPEASAAGANAGGAERTDGAAAETSIDAKNFKRTLQQVERGHEVCCSVMYSLLFTVIFVACVVVHLRPATTYQVEGTLTREFVSVEFDDDGTTYYGIAKETDFWLWMNQVVVPVTLQQYDIVGDPLEPSLWSRIATYNSLVAGVRLRTWRAPPHDCPDEDMNPLYGQDVCYPHSGGGNSGGGSGPDYDTADFGLPACNYATDDSGVGCYNATKYAAVVNVSYQEGFRADAPHEYFEIFLDKYDTVETSQLRLEYAEARHWLDDATVKTEVDVLTYNGELDMLCYVQMKQWFRRGGSVEPVITVSSSFAKLYDKTWYYALDALFVAAVLTKLLLELRELWPYVRDCNIVAYFREGNEDGIWNMVDWIAILLCLLLIGFWVSYVAEMRQVTADLAAVGEQNLYISEKILVNRDFLQTDYYQAYITDVEAASAELSAAVHTKNIVRYLAAFNSFMIIVRFFKVARFLPRANLLVQTVNIALVDLVHYAAVFLFVLVGFAIEAWVVFGHRIAVLGTLWKSIQTSMLVVMGAVDTTQLYLDMMEVSAFTTVMWYWGFFFIMILVVMNLLIAIIIDAYAEARGNVKESDTLYGELLHVRNIISLYWRPGYKPPRELLLCFAPGGSLHGCDTVTADLLVEKVESPGAAPWLRKILRFFFRSGPQHWHRSQPGVYRASSSVRRSKGAVAAPGPAADAAADAGAAIEGTSMEGSRPEAHVTFEASAEGGHPAGDGKTAAYGGAGGDAGSTQRRQPQLLSRLQFRGRSGSGAAAAAAAPESQQPQRGFDGEDGEEEEEEEEAVPHLDRHYAEDLIRNACREKVERGEAHGMTLSNAAKEISDALIRVKLMSERFSNVEDMLADLIAARGLVGGTSGESAAATPQRVRFRYNAALLPEPPLTRRAMDRMAALAAEAAEQQPVQQSAAAAAADDDDRS